MMLSHSLPEQASICIDTLLYGIFDIPVVDKMLVLGTMLDREGSTATSMEYRFSQAAKCYWSHSKTLEARGGGISHKLRGFSSAVGGTLLHGSEGWVLTRERLHQLRTWENQKLRRTLRMRRRPDEGRQTHFERTATAIGDTFKKLGYKRLHHRALTAVHRWATRVLNFKLPGGHSPLADLLNARTKQQWGERRDAWQWLDPHSTLGWRHRKPGSIRGWEQIFVDTMGMDWRQLATSQPTLWSRGERDWLNKASRSLGLPELAPTRAPAEAHLSASLTTPTWLPEDLCQLWRNARCFELRLDNQLLVDRLRAKSRTMNITAAWTTLLDTIAFLVEHGWTPRQRTGHWAHWVPRHRNKLADAMANMAMDNRCNLAWASSTAPTADLGNFIWTSDGGYRHRSGESASAWACWRVHDGDIVLAACGAVYVQNGQDSLCSEMHAVELSVGSFLKLASRCADIIPHIVQVYLSNSQVAALQQ